MFHARYRPIAAAIALSPVTISSFGPDRGRSAGAATTDVRVLDRVPGTTLAVGANVYEPGTTAEFGDSYVSTLERGTGRML